MTDHDTTTATTQTARRAWPLPLAAGERPLIFTHQHYRRIREAGDPLHDYDILMRAPETPPNPPNTPDRDPWQRVPATKYLKYRALEWTEAETLHDLPEYIQPQAEDTFNALGHG